MRNQLWMMGSIAALVLAGAACVEAPAPEPTPDAPATDNGVVKTVDGKADRWDWRNSPSRLRTSFDYVLDNLPSEGAVDRVNWAASYWPYYEDGINARWQGNDVLSPAEKYDKAFNNWTPDDGFMDLRPYDNWSCEWDDAYYEALGPAARWTDRNKGNWTAHNGIDDDNDGVEDADECGYGDDKDYDGVETWWGICHAWAPAAILEPEPQAAVERNGVRFDVSDLKALLIQQYDRSDAYMVGGRCNERELERDEDGRLTRSECRDLNAGSWHVIVTNLIGKDKRPFVIERTTNYEVWNQPFSGYRITEQREITLEEAHELLDVETVVSGNTGVFVHSIEEESALAQAILDFVNTATETELDDDAALMSDAVREIVAARPILSLEQLDEVPQVGASAFRSLQRYLETNDMVPRDASQGYAYSDATRFVEVRMTTDWVTESHPSTEPMTARNDRYVRHDNYHYILELDDDGKIIGGEWLGSSIENHPDFVWLPVRARGGNPHLDIDVIREMIQETLTPDDDDDDDGDDTTGPKSFARDVVVSIPDNDPAGAADVLSVTDRGVVSTVKLDLEIEHTYRGDLLVELKHGGIAVTVYDGRNESSPWNDDVSLSGLEVDGFLGAPLEGDWELRVYDSAGWDVGNIVKWGLVVETN